MNEKIYYPGDAEYERLRYCLDVQQMRHFYDEAVPKEERERMQAHLAKCTQCKTAYEIYIKEREAYEAGEPTKFFED